MKPSKKRVKSGSRESLKHKKSNPNVPAALGVFLYLPGVGSVLDYEWFEQPVSAEPIPLKTSERAKETLAEYLLADKEALRSFCLGQQYAADFFKATGQLLSFIDCAGVLSGGAL